MKKTQKTFLIWLILIILWNFGVPGASPVYDVLVAVVLSLLAKVLEKNVSSNLDSNNFTLLLFVFLILIIFTHRKNILNLKNRKEHKIKL